MNPSQDSGAVPPHTVPLREDAAVMGLVGLAHACSHFSHLLLPPLFPVFMREFGLSFAEVGGLMSMFFLVSGSGQALSGFVVDRWGARPVLFASLLLFMASAWSASAATGYGGLLLSALLAGLGNAPLHPVDFSILNQRVSAPRLGHAFSVHGLTGNLGWALAPVFLTVVMALSDWRQAYRGAIVLYLVVLLLLLWQRKRLRTEVVSRQHSQAGGSDLGYLRLPVVWWCFSFFFLVTITMAVVQNFAPSILEVLHAVSIEAATLTLTAYMLCGAAGMLVGGFVAARQQRSERVVAWCMASGGALLLLCATGWLGGPGTMAVLALSGFAIGVGGPSRDMMIRRATPAGATGRVYGTVYSGLDLGMALAPLLFGALMDRAWYSATLAGAGLVLLLAVGVAIRVGRLTVARG